MLLTFITISFLPVFQLFCIRKGKKKIAKTLPLVIGLLLTSLFFIQMAWDFSLSNSVNAKEFYRHENQFALLFVGAWLGVVNLTGGRLIYGVIKKKYQFCE